MTTAEAGGDRRRARIVAFYLPQFHPIPENDRWWGTGFTEWTNVSRAQPLFRGHRQPRVPADLGFYDLRLPETRAAQAELAAGHGLAGFCYWHYWFGGKRLLERPFEEVMKSGEPDFPFCLAWANEPWTRTWLGRGEVLQEQPYSSDDDLEHARWLVSALADDRALKLHGRPLFLVYRPNDLPRRGRKGVILVDNTPELFEAGLRELVDAAESKPFDERLVFVNAWNEWAEGNYLEPDTVDGLARLEAVRRVVTP